MNKIIIGVVASLMMLSSVAKAGVTIGGDVYLKKSDCVPLGDLAQEVAKFRINGGTKDVAISLMKIYMNTPASELYFKTIIDVAYSGSIQDMGQPIAFKNGFLKFCHNQAKMDQKNKPDNIIDENGNIIKLD